MCLYKLPVKQTGNFVHIFFRCTLIIPNIMFAIGSFKPLENEYQIQTKALAVVSDD